MLGIAIPQGCPFETGDNTNTNANVYTSSGLDLYYMDKV